MVQGVGGEHQACACTYDAIGIGAQLKALATQAAPVVVGAVDQVAHIELAGVLGGFELDAALMVGVVKHQLVVARLGVLATPTTSSTIPPFLGAYAPLGGGVVMAAVFAGVGATGLAVAVAPVGAAKPGGAVAAGTTAGACHQVALGAGAVVERGRKGVGERIVQRFVFLVPFFLILGVLGFVLLGFI